jgi:putative oxidoreductase
MWKDLVGPRTHTVLRIAVGLLFMQHGLQKHFGFFGGIDGGTVPLLSMMGLAGALELVGGLFLIFGLFVRPVAVLLLLEMISAYFIAHVSRGGWPIQNQGELALLYASVFIFLAGNGAGPFSVDQALAGSGVPTGERRHLKDRRHPAAA